MQVSVLWGDQDLRPARSRRSLHAIGGHCAGQLNELRLQGTCKACRACEKCRQSAGIRSWQAARMGRQLAKTTDKRKPKNSSDAGRPSAAKKGQRDAATVRDAGISETTLLQQIA